MEDGFAPKKYDQETKARALRMVREHLPTYRSVTRTAEAVGPHLGISSNILRRWVQADVDDGVCEGTPSEVQAELARLTAEKGAEAPYLLTRRQLGARPRPRVRWSVSRS